MQQVLLGYHDPTRGKVIEIERVTLHILLRSQVFERQDGTVDVPEPACSRDELQPAPEEGIPPLPLEVYCLVLANKPEGYLHCRRVPCGGGPHANFPEGAQRPALLALSVVSLQQARL